MFTMFRSSCEAGVISDQCEQSSAHLPGIVSLSLPPGIVTKPVTIVALIRDVDINRRHDNNITLGNIYFDSLGDNFAISGL